MLISVQFGYVGPDLSTVLGRVQATDMFDRMGQALLTRVRSGMEAEHTPGGAAWEPLKKGTVRRRGSAHPVLRVTGRLYKSITSTADAAHAQVGTNLAYAAIHQFGGVIQRKAGTSVLAFKRYKAKNGSRTFFTRNNKKATFGMKAAHGAYGIPIPARPYVFDAQGGVPRGWLTALERIFLRTLRLGGDHAQSN